MRLRRAFVGLVCALGVTGVASGAGAQTLADSLAATYETNPTLLAARAQLRAVNEGVPQALSGWRPNVTVDGSIGYEWAHSNDGGSSTASLPPPFDELSLDSTRDGSTWPKQVSLNITQPLYQGGIVSSSVDSAEALVQSQRALLRDTEQTVLLAAVTSYMDLWLAFATLDLNRANEERLLRQLQATRDRFSVGEVTRTDVAQAESAYQTAIANRINSEAQVNIAQATFRQVIGLNPVSVSYAPPVEGIPTSRDETISGALENEPNVVAARHLESSALSDIRATLGQLFPQVSLVGVLAYNADSSVSGIDTTSAQILAQVSVPLYLQGLPNSQVREAKQVASQRRLQISETLRSAEQSAVSAWDDLISAKAQLESLRAAVEAAQIALEGIEQEAAVGARTVLDVLDSEQDLLDAQTSLVEAQRDETVASFQVLQAVGRLTASDLALPVPIYNPEIDYRKVRDAWFTLDAPND